YTLHPLAEKYPLRRGRFYIHLALRGDHGGLCVGAAQFPRRGHLRGSYLHHLSGATHAPLHPALGRDRRLAVPAWEPAELAVGVDRGLSDLPSSVLHLASDRLFPDHSEGVGRGRYDRWGHPDPGDVPGHSSPGITGRVIGGDVRFYAGGE